LARAGLDRLGRGAEATGVLREMIPAAGQGALAVTVRADDGAALEAVAAVSDAAAARCLTAERALVRALEADCHTPVGAHATLDEGALVLRAFVGAPDGAAWLRDELSGDDPEALGAEEVPQEETTRLVVEHALAGRDVVRLKGGDPFVFGRGGEEAQACRAAGVPFEVVPGVTAGVAAPAYAGIPVTQRGMASAVAFVTGHEDPAKPETAIDWAALAAFPGTLVFYMGVRQLPRIAEQLVAHGRDPGEPAAIVERGTLPEQR